MEVIKSFKTKLYPNSSQKADLSRMFGADRFIFNQLLGKVQNFGFGSYKKDPSKPNIPSKITLINEITNLKGQFGWLYATPNDYLQASASNLSKAFEGFYRTGGYPKFKSKKNIKQSLNMYAGSRVRIKENRIFIPNRKDGIKFKKHFEFPQNSKITGYTISKDSVGDYFISFTYKYDVCDIVQPTLKPVGCDLGLKETLICSDGTTFKRLNLTKKYEKRLKNAQQSLSRKKKGSKNRVKARIKVAKIHRKIGNIRKNYNHNISSTLTSKYNFIALESLNIKNMVKNKRLSKAIQDVAWGQLISFVKYKQAEKQGLFVQIDTYFPSSKTCSCCGNVRKNLSLHERVYECTQCGHTMDRDLNASINILNEGLRASEE